MTPAVFSSERFARAPLVGIVRNLSLDDLIHILPLYRAAGLTTIEITMNTPDAETMIRYGLEHYAPDLNIGAGTVCTEDDLAKALAAGAQFIVTPIIDENVIRSCVQQSVPIFPGAFTPSEIYRAWSLGATMVKIFPSTSLGPDYIKDLKAPLNGIKVLPTGGVSLENMADFLRAGADGVGIGSQLFDKKLIQQGAWSALQEHFQRFSSQLSLNA